MRHQSSTTLTRTPLFGDPYEALNWAARHYLSSASRGEPTPPEVNMMLRRWLAADAEHDLTQALEFLVFHTTAPLRVSDGWRHELAVHEIAIVNGIRALRFGSLLLYCDAMRHILTTEDALSIGPWLQNVANAIGDTQLRGFIQSARLSVDLVCDFAGQLT